MYKYRYGQVKEIFSSSRNGSCHRSQTSPVKADFNFSLIVSKNLIALAHGGTSYNHVPCTY